MRFPSTIAIGAASLVATTVAVWMARSRKRLQRRCLTLVQEIPLLLPDDQRGLRAFAEGRIDHFACDPAHKLLFVACLGEDCVLIIDAFAGRVVRILRDGLSRPQGVLFVAETNRLYVANAADGVVVVFDALTWERVGSIDLGDEADNLRYDGDGRVFVGFGEGAIGVIEDGTVRHDSATDLPCGEHPESFQLERRGEARRIWVNVADRREVLVLDRSGAAPPLHWALPDGLGGNFPMHADEDARLLFVGVRAPAHRSCILVLDLDSGEELRRVACAGDMDDLCFDARRSRLYVVSGTGRVVVLGRESAAERASFAPICELETALGARTGFFYTERDSLYVAAPTSGGMPSRLLVFQGFGDGV